MYFDVKATNFQEVLEVLNVCCNVGAASPLGLMGREPARQTSEPGSNSSRDATVHQFAEHLM